MLNSVDSPEAEAAVMTCVNAFTRLGGAVFFSGRPREEEEQRNRMTKVTGRGGQRYVEFWTTRASPPSTGRESGSTRSSTPRRRCASWPRASASRSPARPHRLLLAGAGAQGRRPAVAQIAAAFDFEFNLPVSDTRRLDRHADVKRATGTPARCRILTSSPRTSWPLRAARIIDENDVVGLTVALGCTARGGGRMKVRKLERPMEAWVLATDAMPLEVLRWVHHLPGRLVVLVSPRAPHHTAVMPLDDCVVIRSEVGCLYAVTRKDSTPNMHALMRSCCDAEVPVSVLYLVGFTSTAAYASVITLVLRGAAMTPRPHVNAVRVTARHVPQPADVHPNKVFECELGRFRVYDSGGVDRLSFRCGKPVAYALTSTNPLTRRVRALARAA